MSRTIRRKKANKNERCWLPWNTERVHYTKNIPRHQPENTDGLRCHYHSDSWRASPPKDFRQMLNREHRARNKNILRKNYQYPDEVLNFYPFAYDVDWEYW